MKLCNISVEQLITFCIIYLSLANGSSLSQPIEVEILDGTTFTLNVEYCSFTVYNDLNAIILSLNTRCYCFDTELNKNSMKILSKATNNNNKTSITKALNNTNPALLCSIPGPTLIINQGITFDINLINNLIGSSFNPNIDYEYKIRNWPDVINLHTHGLHVSPEWDNVFEAINPNNNNKLLHYVIPSNHYPGTLWYHSHFHQSTDFQIQGGLFGALIIKQSENQYKDDFVENIILQFHFLFFYTTSTCDCDIEEGELWVNYCYGAGFWELCSLCFNWCANPNDKLIESGFNYNAESILADENGKVDIALVNGQYKPEIDILANRWYKLSLINSNGQYYTQLRWPQQCDIYFIGADGVYFQNGSRDLSQEPYLMENIMDPGSRNEIAIRCGLLHIGQRFNVYYSQNYGSFNLLPRFPDNEISFILHITAPINEDNDIVNVINDEPHYNIPPLPDYLYDSYNNPDEESPYKITSFCPCWTYEGGEFDMRCHWYLGRFGTSINGQMWNGPNEPILYVCNGEIYEFDINSLHPLHLHTSQFQLIQDLPQYEPQKGFLAKAGDFRDTVSTIDGDFKIRYQATHFVGPIITHCHFLPHEDEGMMVYFQIVDCQKNINISTLNPFHYNPLNNKNIPDECDIFHHEK